MRMPRRTALATMAGAAGMLASNVVPSRRAAAEVAAQRPTRVRTGLDRLAADGYEELIGQRVGILTNPTGVFADLRHGVDVLHGDSRVSVSAVFGPEHGFRGTAQANDSEGSFVDPKTGLRVYDTFELSGQRLAEVFAYAGVDTVLFDIADVGARFFTYIWTMFDAMEAAAFSGKRFVVLDRPNPIGLCAARGPVLRAEYASFVGRAPIAQQHGMTIGELAELFNAEFLSNRACGAVELTVLAMDGWRRDMAWEATGLPWVLPSPNMPTLETVAVYPGTCLLSGTNLSQGRGTARPFTMVGAPFVDHRWAESLSAHDSTGALAVREAYFVPTDSTFVGENCAGIDVSVRDPRQVDAVAFGVAMVRTLRDLYPEFAWRNEGTEETPKYWIDNLTGSDLVRTGVDAGHDVDTIVASWQPELAEFESIRARYLRY